MQLHEALGRLDKLPLHENTTVSAVELGKFIDDAVSNLRENPDDGSTWYKYLDGSLGIAIGWEDGYDTENGYEVAAKICNLDSDFMKDYNFLTMPYDRDTGEVWDTTVSNPSSADASWFIKQLNAISDAVDKGELVTEGVNVNKHSSRRRSLTERGLTKAERHNRDMEKISNNYKAQQEKYKKFLASKGVSKEDINELARNSGLHGNALGEKAHKMASAEEWKKLHESRKTKLKESAASDNHWSVKYQDLIEDLVDRVDDPNDEDDVMQAVDDGLIYTSDMWTAVEEILSPTDLAEWDDVFMQVVDDVYAELKDRGLIESLKSRKTKLKESSSTIKPGDIYDVVIKELDSKDIDHHASDLYVRKTPESTEIINRLSNKSLVSTFKDNIDGDIWYELPFCYTPHFNKSKVKESISNINRILHRLNEAPMSDEDREDTYKLQKLAQKIKHMDGRTNPSKMYTDDEIELAKKYNLQIPQKRSDYRAITDKDTKGNITDRLATVYAKTADVRNDADWVRKNKERSTEDDGHGFKERRYSPYGGTPLEQDRNRDAANMSSNVRNMKGALRDRKFHNDKVKQADKDFEKAIRKAAKDRDLAHKYHSEASTRSQNRIDDILANAKKRNKNESLKESENGVSKWVLVDYYDVWGNADDGWEVNNVSREDEITISDDASDKEIFEYLRDIVKYFNKSLKFEDVYVTSDGDIIEFEASADGMPICRLERVG